MADERISDLPSLPDPKGSDYLVIIKNRVGQQKVSHKISLGDLFKDIRSNTEIFGELVVRGEGEFQSNVTFIGDVDIQGNTSVETLTIQSNGITIGEKLTPASSSVPEIEVGKVFFDENYLYIKVANTTIKRIGLESF